MPIFTETGPEARSRLQKGGKGYQQRQAYREALADLAEGQHLEVEPELGETMRGIKGSVRRAARDLGIHIAYGETRGLGWLYVTDPSANRIVAVPVTRPAANVARARQTPPAQPRRRLPG